MTDPFTPSAELAAIAKRWLEYHAIRRTQATANLFSRSAAVTYIGSDESEVLTGDGFHETFIEFFNDGALLETRDIEAHGYQAGDFGWAWTTLTVVAPDAGKEMKFRNSFVFSLEDGVWRLVHVHNSNPKPNIESMGYASGNLEELAKIAREEKLNLGQTGIASVMFTDIVDSTALAAAMGDAAWSRKVKQRLAQVTDHVVACGGTLVKSLGDGTLSSFTSAQAAMQAARIIQRHNAKDTDEPHLAIRIGLHTGDVVQTEGDYLGSVVNKAARIAAIAAPEEIRVSDATRIMVGTTSDFTFSEPTMTEHKGLDGEHRVYQLKWRE